MYHLHSAQSAVKVVNRNRPQSKLQKYNQIESVKRFRQRDMRISANVFTKRYLALAFDFRRRPQTLLSRDPYHRHGHLGLRNSDTQHALKCHVHTVKPWPSQKHSRQGIYASAIIGRCRNRLDLCNGATKTRRYRGRSQVQ